MRKSVTKLIFPASALILLGCAGSNHFRYPAVGPRPWKTQVSPAEVISFHKSRLSSVYDHMVSLNCKRCRTATKKRLNALTEARDQLVSGLLDLTNDLETYAPDSKERSTYLVFLYQYIMLLGKGQLPGESAVSRLGVSKVKQKCKPFPLSQYILTPCIEPSYLVIILCPFAVIDLPVIVPLDVADFFLGAWWWAGEKDYVWLPVPPSDSNLMTGVENSLNQNFKNVSPKELYDTGKIKEVKSVFGFLLH